MRVSKADGSQIVALQRDALLAAGVDAAQLYEDHASGRTDDRPGLASCLKALREGDRLVVWKLDRLGWNLLQLVNTVHDLTARGVGLKVLTGCRKCLSQAALGHRTARCRRSRLSDADQLRRPHHSRRRSPQRLIAAPLGRPDRGALFLPQFVPLSNRVRRRADHARIGCMMRLWKPGTGGYWDRACSWTVPGGRSPLSSPGMACA